MAAAPRYCFNSLGSWERNASLARLRELGSEFIRRGLSVSYLVDDLPYNRTADLRLHPQATIHFVGGRTVLARCAARRAAVRRINPDYVHILNPTPKSVLTFAPMSGQRIVGDMDEWYASAININALTQPIISIMHRWLVRRSSLLVVASRYLQRQMLARYRRHALYLPYALFPQPHPDGESPYREPTAVYVGTFFRGYDLDLIFDAALLLEQRGVRANIVLFGDGAEFDHWSRFVANHRLSGLKMPGFLRGAELWRHVRHAKVLLFPIRPTLRNQARCPSKTYMYAQAHRPVITNRIGEIHAVLGENGIYVEPSATAFADAIETALRTPTPDIDYGVEAETWSRRAQTLLDALPQAEQRRDQT